jgi:peptidoglycan/LPS O-acetylase OafA/YrhL
MVILRHSWSDIFGLAGIIGVVAFFTLSGYLITGLLVADIERFGRVRYRHFYRNRALRLVPALVFMLAGFAIVEGILDPSGTRSMVFTSVVVALLYVMNIPGFPHGSPNLSHLWTLANEEQFYLGWPVLLYVGIRFRRLGLLVALAAAVIILALVATIVVASPDIYKVYTLPPSWTIAMVIGAAAQIWKNRVSRFLHGKFASAAASVALVAAVALAFVPDDIGSPATYLFGGPVISALSVVVIWKLREWQVVSTVLRPLVWLGTISYAAYIWNYPISWWLRDSNLPGWEIWTVVLTLVAAVTSWFLVERPFNNLKKRWDSRAAENIAANGPATKSADTFNS